MGVYGWGLEGPAYLVEPLYPFASLRMFSCQEAGKFSDPFAQKERLDCLRFDVCGLRINHFLLLPPPTGPGLPSLLSPPSNSHIGATSN